MKAIWKDTIIAEALQEELVSIEGNWYFPPASLRREYIKDSDVHTTCVWKGEASYYDLEVNGESNEGAAWYYPELKAGSRERVGKDFTNYVAFWRGVMVTE